MTDHPTDATAEPAVERRRLLIATAAAPIVATLPHGGAWATSIYQCIQDSSNQSDSALLSSTELDQWVRVEALAGRFSPPAGGRPVTLWSLDVGETWRDAENDVKENVSTDGNCDSTSQYCLLPNETIQTAYVLASYTADPDVPNATSVVFQGLYPEESPEAQGGDSGNIGLLTSCLCSLNPSTGPRCPT